MKTALEALLWLVCTGLVCGAATIHVPGDAATIQDALDRTSAGDTVLVAPGEYVIGEALSFNRTGSPRNVSLVAEEGPAQTTIRMSGEPTDIARGSVIAFEKGETAASVLRGFTLTGGTGMQSGTFLYGGGIFVANASAPMIVDCVISGNRADHGGGAYLGTTTAATFTDCMFADNAVSDVPGTFGCGGALHAEGATVACTGCSFERNYGYYGGAVYALGTSATFVRCEFRKNRCAVNGGALLVNAADANPPRFTCRLEDAVLADNVGAGEGSRGAGLSCQGIRLEVSGCVIERNRATVRGGGIDAVKSHVFIENSRLAGNECGEGGGLGLWSCGAGAVTNCVFAGNRAASEGGGMYSYSSPLAFSHCTIAGNVGIEGGGCRIQCSRPSFADCIVWDNAGSAVFAEPEWPCSLMPTFESCTIESVRVWPGSGNSNSDPRFIGWGARTDVYVDASAGADGDGTSGSPYRDIAPACDGAAYSLVLSHASPCVGTGTGGSTRGAELGTSGSVVGPVRTVHVASGRYGLENAVLVHRISVRGSGVDATVLEGTVRGLQAGAVLSDCTFEGGGIAVAPEMAPEVRACAVVGAADAAGAGISVGRDAAPRLSRVSVRGFPKGGLVCDRAKARAERCTFTGNLLCGASFTDDGRSRLEHCDVRGNAGRGVGCIGTSFPELVACVIRNNESAGIVCEDASFPTLRGCIVRENGGAALWAEQGSPTCVNCLLLANGGGPAGSGAYTNCTIAYNGDLQWSSGTLLLTHCIYWRNAFAEPWGERFLCWFDAPGFVREGTFDLARTTAATICGEVHALPDYVVVEPDCRLAPGSPCIDAARAERAPEEDLACTPRPCGADADIGAYEHCAEQRFVRGDANGDGRIDIADPVMVLAYLFAGGTAPRCDDAADGNDDGRLSLSDGVAVLRYIFNRGQPPAMPFPLPGLDPTADALACGEGLPPCVPGAQ